MTPSNTTDRETSAVMEAFGIKSSSSETENRGGSGAEQNNSAQNSQTNTQVQSTEKERGAGKVIEIIPQAKATQQTNRATETAENKTEVDYEKYISETLGDTTPNIKARLGKVKELEELVNKSPYKSSVGEVFDDLVSKGVPSDVAIRFINSDKDKMSHKEVMAFALHQERPNVSLDKINDYIDQQYKLGAYAEDGNEAPGLTRLEFDVQPHIEKFDQLKQKLVQHGQSRGAMEANKQESARIESWKEPTKRIFSEFTKIDIPTATGSVLRFKVEMDAAEQNELLTEFSAMISTPGFAADEAGVQRAKEALQSRYVAKHINEMAISFMQQGRSMSEENWIALVHNPSIANTKGQSEFGGGAKGRDQALADMILNAEGGNRKK